MLACDCARVPVASPAPGLAPHLYHLIQHVGLDGEVGYSPHQVRRCPPDTQCQPLGPQVADDAGRHGGGHKDSADTQAVQAQAAALQDKLGGKESASDGGVKCS